MDKVDPKLISLKDASKISGYSADYIGQLIRSGKIPGKQVYVNVAWMTTADAVLAYKNGDGVKKGDEKTSILSKLAIQKRKLAMGFEIIKLFFQTFKSALPIALVIIVSFILLNIFIFYNITHKLTNNTANEVRNEQKFSF